MFPKGFKEHHYANDTKPTQSVGTHIEHFSVAGDAKEQKSQRI